MEEKQKKNRRKRMADDTMECNVKGKKAKHCPEEEGTKCQLEKWRENKES